MCYTALVSKSFIICLTNITSKPCMFYCSLLQQHLFWLVWLEYLLIQLNWKLCTDKEENIWMWWRDDRYCWVSTTTLYQGLVIFSIISINSKCHLYTYGCLDAIHSHYHTLIAESQREFSDYWRSGLDNSLDNIVLSPLQVLLAFTDLALVSMLL